MNNFFCKFASAKRDMMKTRPFILLLMLNVLPACGGQQSAGSVAQDTDPTDFVWVDEDTKEPGLTDVIYTPADSAKVVQLLKDAHQRKPEMTRMEYFGRQFLGVPYVAHTLETDPEKEQLAVNLQELDCTTFVETCAALSLCDQRDERSFEAYCKALTELRYKDGVRNGYASRLHYFMTWVKNNIEMGFLEDTSHDGYPFTAVKKLDLHYMSKHPELYKQLAEHPEWIKEVAEQENSVKGWEVNYVPKDLLNGSPQKLSDIKNGDIIGILTTKDGLDTTHLGIAVWKDGKLHLMNASSVYHKVVIDNNTFYNYMAKRKQNLGIALVRLKDNNQ